MNSRRAHLKAIEETDMRIRNEILWCAPALVAVALFLLIPVSGFSEEATKEYLTAEEYIELAQPYLHLSCEGAWAEAEEDGEAYIQIVNKVSAIGFLNHDLDIEDVYRHSEEEVGTLRVEYYNEIGRLCGENPNLLLAGVVERSLLHAFTKIAPEAIED
jgi:hypothetical protein